MTLVLITLVPKHLQRSGEKMKTKLNKNKGYTIIELSVAMAIAAILMGAAVPSYQRVTTNSQMNKAMHDLQGAIMLVRSEAIKRNSNVVLKFNSDWSDGLLITTNPNRTYNECIATPSDDCIHVFQPSSTDYTVSATNGATELVYRRSGRPLDNISFTLCPSSNSTNYDERLVSMGTTGIPAISFENACS